MEKIPPKSNSLLRLLCCFVLLPINTHTRTYSISMLPEAKAVPPGIPQLLSTQSSQFGSPGPKPWNAFSSSSTQTSRPVSMSSYVFRNKMMNVRNPSPSPLSLCCHLYKSKCRYRGMGRPGPPIPPRAPVVHSYVLSLCWTNLRKSSMQFTECDRLAFRLRYPASGRVAMSSDVACTSLVLCRRPPMNCWNVCSKVEVWLRIGLTRK